MDADLAGAVFARWEQGLPVYEGTLYKAAQILGVDPVAALTEARYYTQLDRALASGDDFSPAQREFFSVASGYDPSAMEKTAEAYGFDSPDALIMRALKRRDFAPDLEKLAMFPGPEQMAGGDAGGGDPAAGGAPPEGADPQMAGAGAMGPQPGMQVQQNPTVRPTPTAPEQLAASSEGNLQSLLGDAAEQPGAAENGGLPPSGGPPGGQPMPSPQERLQSAIPDIPPDAVERYAPKLEQVEQEAGMTMMDPKQIEKFVKEMQKLDKKVMDEAIKDFAQREAEAMGQSTPGSAGKWDTTAPQPNGGGAAGSGAASQQPEPAAPAAPSSMSKAAAAGALWARRRQL